MHKTLFHCSSSPPRMHHVTYHVSSHCEILHWPTFTSFLLIILLILRATSCPCRRDLCHFIFIYFSELFPLLFYHTLFFSITLPWHYDHRMRRMFYFMFLCLERNLTFLLVILCLDSCTSLMVWVAQFLMSRRYFLVLTYLSLCAGSNPCF